MNFRFCRSSDHIFYGFHYFCARYREEDVDRYEKLFSPVGISGRQTYSSRKEEKEDSWTVNEWDPLTCLALLVLFDF